MSKIITATYKGKTATNYPFYLIHSFARHEGQSTAEFIEKWNKKLKRKGVNKQALFNELVKNGKIKLVTPDSKG